MRPMTTRYLSFGLLVDHPLVHLQGDSMEAQRTDTEAEQQVEREEQVEEATPMVAVVAATGAVIAFTDQVAVQYSARVQ